MDRVADKAETGGNRLVIVESPAKARTISGYLGKGFTVSSSVGHIRDLPSRASEIPKEQRAKYGTMGVAIEDEFEPLYLVDKDKKKTVDDLKKQLKLADELLLATDEDREGEAIALAPEGGPQADGSGAADGLPRDHARRDPAFARTHARDRRSPRRRAGDPANPRQAVRLRGLARPLEEGVAGALGRPRAVGRDAPRRRARAGADRVRGGRVLGPRGDLRPGLVHRPPRRARRQARRERRRLRLRRKAQEQRDRAPGRGGRARVARPARGRGIHRPQQGRQALHPQADCTVSHGHPSAGGEPQAPLLLADDDARRTASVRERLHHLHADRFDVALRGGGRRSRAGR